MDLVFYPTAHLDKNGAQLIVYYDELTRVLMAFEDVLEHLAAGQEVRIRPATHVDAAAIAHIETQIAIVKAQRAAALPPLTIKDWIENVGREDFQWPPMTEQQARELGQLLNAQGGKYAH